MSEKVFNKSRINYTQISNQILRNNELSWGAKGLLSYMLSRPENWDFNMKEIASNSNESYGMCQKYMKELIDKNYIVRIKRGVKGVKGKFEIVYYLNDRPFTNEEIEKIQPNPEKMDTPTAKAFNDNRKQRQSFLTTVVSNDERKSGSYNNTEYINNTDKDNNTNIERKEDEGETAEEKKEITTSGAYYQSVKLLLSEYKTINYESVARAGKPIERIKAVLEFAKKNGKGEGWIVGAIKYDYKLDDSYTKNSKKESEGNLKNPA